MQKLECFGIDWISWLIFASFNDININIKIRIKSVHCTHMCAKILPSNDTHTFFSFSQCNQFESLFWKFKSITIYFSSPYKMNEWLNGFLPSKLFPIHFLLFVWFRSLWFNKLSLWHFKNSSLQSVNGIVLMLLRIVACSKWWMVSGAVSHSMERKKPE